MTKITQKLLSRFTDLLSLKKLQFGKCVITPSFIMRMFIFNMIRTRGSYDVKYTVCMTILMYHQKAFLSTLVKHCKLYLKVLSASASKWGLHVSTGGSWLMRFFGYLFHYCDLPYANFGYLFHYCKYLANAKFC